MVLEREGNFLLLQATFAASMFAGCFISFILPIKLLERSKRVSSRTSGHEKSNEPDSDWAIAIVAHCNCIGAGIFVAICFMGLMPVVNSEFANYFKASGMVDVNYPFAEFTTLIGFFLVLFLEEFVTMCRRAQKPPVLQLDDVSTELCQGLLTEPIEDYHTSNLEEISFRDGKEAVEETDAHCHSHSHSHLAAINESGLTFFVLIFATSVHSIFEGLALGLMNEPSKASHIFIGIILHECIVAAALGINSIRLNPHESGIKFGIMFSSTVPLGIIIGVAIGMTPGPFGRLISAIFQGLAAGTFLHVSFCELIPSELSSSEPQYGLRKFRIFKICLIFLGFLLMSMLTAFISD